MSTGNLFDFTVSKKQEDKTALPREIDVAADLIRRLSPWFHIETEVRGVHFSNKKPKRIDLVIRPKCTEGWRNKDVAFGVEIKRGEERSLGDCGRHFGQAIDYANTLWDGYGYLHILTFPRWYPTAEYLKNNFQIEKPQGMWFMLQRFAGRAGVGELNNDVNREMQICINGDELWSSKFGASSKAAESLLERKFGSR